MIFFILAACSALLFLVSLTVIRIFLNRPVRLAVCIEQLHFILSARGQADTALVTGYGPVQFGYTDDCSVRLDAFNKPGGRIPAKPELVCHYTDGILHYHSRKPVLQDGVERTNGILGPNSRLNLKNVKIRFVGSEESMQQTRIPRDRRSFRYLYSIPLVFILLAVVFSLIACAQTVVVHRSGIESEALPEYIEEYPATRAEREAAPAETAEVEREDTDPMLPLIVAPGAVLTDVQPDILFIHAHPDDEAIDYGALLALSDQAGLSSAVLLFTDGESGIIQSDYVGPREPLYRIRIAEAAESMRILGVSWYLRKGYRNHPYNALADIKSPEDIINIWGADAAVSEFASLIEKLAPRVIVSPDGPSAAREHFEHEAAGLLVRSAFKELARAGKQLPSYLVCIDPRQSAVYSEYIGILRAPVLDRQIQALQAHKTQADATYFGVNMVRDHEYELYQVLYWNINEDPASYFKASGRKWD